MILSTKNTVFSFVIMTLCPVIILGQFNPSILQDTRDLPKLDGAYGFLYRTEDGIAHAEKADPGGIVHGRFTYTDPTGLKVNFNYNAGSGVTPGYVNNVQSNNNQYQTSYQDNVQQQQQNQQDQYVRRTKPPSFNFQQQQQPVQQDYYQQTNDINNNFNYDYNANQNLREVQWNQHQLRHPLDIQVQQTQPQRYF